MPQVKEKSARFGVIGNDDTHRQLSIADISKAVNNDIRTTLSIGEPRALVKVIERL